nr:flagellar hook-basal body complex protein [uncultured Shimia sp.]
MENASYTTLTRQAGLLREMSVVANNIANASTTGFRQDGMVFSEFVSRTGDRDSLSMATANVQSNSMVQGALTRTGGTFDMAIEGEGFFMVQTPEGERLTRAGSFTPNAQGDLVTLDGMPVLDVGGAPVFVPPSGGDIAVAPDGTLSADGKPITQIGIFMPDENANLVREGGVRFRVNGDVEFSETSKVVQGFLESSNVDAVTQLARMIEVQRAYEMGQGFLESENERIRTALKTFVR